MEKITIEKITYILVNDSDEIKLDDLDGLTENDKNFLINKELIHIKKDNKAKIVFVGKVITPSNNFLSLPKNINKNQEDCELTVELLSHYDHLKKNGKKLIVNKSFSIKKDGDLVAEKYYYNKLLSFFLDYPTYEFYYKNEKKSIHSHKKIVGYIQPLKTKINKKIKGPGITYNIKNKENTFFGDIYYSTLINLSKKFGSDDEIQSIENMRNFLIENNYEINFIEDIDIKKIKEEQTSDIHQTIKKSLINYYENRNLIETSNYKGLYTKNFNQVWEHFLKLALHDTDERENYFGKINNPIIHSYKNNKKYKSKERKLNPDILSKYDNKLFIGDAKYYNDDTDDVDFYKEFFAYNIAFENKYKMILFIPSNKTEIISSRELSENELFIFNLSLREVFLDIKNKTTICLDKIHKIISTI